ncbi:prokaryotic molybdopterin-containing oxidoreductase family, membrane subunit [Muriicola jejuensis]|uniref:Polysulfide reductase n=1 Tax=Muriicola jejuensis TaxID=504488 RepID=A0A6P0UIA3_9FLAO|nr:NrfD/PsrC family molybdoenzyme membrane anchor subunit [Muriicola jejuensis]NER10853.1 polysulfide reductase [Muriicola jejuensis]SMP15927.1 prokaryotic molybdopterin-containing oxidoreductase family, membrane subunit [Muriicola jejuensis]
MKKFDDIVSDLAPREFGKTGLAWIGFLVVLVILGIVAYADQVIQGQKVTNMRDYALWGIYISNFVFFVATSFVGSATVAILRLTNNSWRTPLVRIAEIITLACIVMAGITITIDMARPDRVMNLFIHARLQSPITWDIIIIPTFIVISLLMLYFPLLPDFALMKKHFETSKPRLSRWYGRLSLKWTGSSAQKALHSRSIMVLSVLILIAGVMLQTIDAWLFSTTYRTGWDSSAFAPYFISGAFVAGIGALVTVIYIVRRTRKLEEYITEGHFDKMGKLLTLACIIYLYFNINEYVIPFFTAKKGEDAHLESLLTGHYAGLFWFVTLAGLVLPIFLLLFKKGRKPLPMFFIGIVVVIGSWWKRYIIITPTLLEPFMPIQGVPESWRTYFPSAHEWIITIATLAMALLIITLLVRFLPAVPVQRTADEMETKAEASLKKIAS